MGLGCQWKREVESDALADPFHLLFFTFLLIIKDESNVFQRAADYR